MNCVMNVLHEIRKSIRCKFGPATAAAILRKDSKLRIYIIQKISYKPILLLIYLTREILSIVKNLVRCEFIVSDNDNQCDAFYNGNLFDSCCNSLYV